MDILGLVRRFAGLGGLVLVYMGISSEAEANQMVNTISAVVGGVVFLIDFGSSVFKKISG